MNNVANPKTEVKIPWLAVFALMAAILFQEVPYVPKILGGNPTVLPFMALFALALRKFPLSLPRRHAPMVFGIAAFFLIQAAYRFFGISTSGLGRYTNTIAFFFFFAAMPVVHRMGKLQKRWVFGTVMGTMLFTIVDNIVMFHRFGFTYYSRMVEFDSSVSNAVNTQYTTAVMLLAGICLMAFLHDRSKRLLWGGGFILLNYFNCAVTQRAIALILSFTLFVLIVIFNRKRKTSANLLILFLGFAGIWMLENHETVLSYLGDLLTSDRLARRLQQISNMMDSGDITAAGGSMTGRYNLTMRSLETWTSSVGRFFLGAGDHYIDNTIIGNHCQWIDLLAQYGIVVAGMVYALVYGMLRLLVGRLDLPAGPLLRQVLVLCGIFLARGFLGAVFFGTIGIQLFIVLPLAIDYLKKKREVPR